MPQTRINWYPIRHWLYHHRVLVAIFFCFVFFVSAASIYVIKTIKINSDIKNYRDSPVNQNPSTTQKLSTGSTFTTAFTTVSTEMATKPIDYSDWRLKNTCVPKKYDLTLVPDLENGEYSGTIVIDFEALEQVTIIKLNSQGLVFGRGSCKINFYEPASVVFDQEKGKKIPFSVSDTRRNASVA